MTYQNFAILFSHPKHWNNDSVFIDYDEFICLSSYQWVIPDYPYFDVQEVTTEQWKKIERLALEEGKYKDFFQVIREWKCRDPEGSKTFWILGV